MQLRELQHADRLAPILASLLKSREQCLCRFARPPLLVKISPDQSEQQLVALLQLLRTLGLDGVIRKHRRDSPHTRRECATARWLERCATVAARTDDREHRAAGLGPRAAIIGAGGIGSAADARSVLAAGADLVQIHTGLVYHGPALIHELRSAL